MKLLALIILPSVAFAQNQPNSSMGDNNNINNCNPVLKCPTQRVIYATHKQVAKISELERELDALKKSIKSKDLEISKLKYEISRPPKKEIVMVSEKIKDTAANSVGLLVGASPTRLKTDTAGPSYTAQTVYEEDLGLMYQRDFNTVRMSVGITIRGSALLGVGINF